MEAVGHAGTCMGILAKDGIVLCAEKKNQHKLLDINPCTAEKIFQVDDHVAVGIAGITADANALIEQIRVYGKGSFEQRSVHRNLDFSCRNPVMNFCFSSAVQGHV